MSTLPVDPIVEMLIDGTWVDITEDVRLNSADSGGGISITRGVPNGGNRAEPTSVDLVLNNVEGKYSPQNPYSIYRGKIGRNQPIRIGLSRRRDTFQRTETGSWGRLPSRVTPELQTVLGDRWNITGAAANFSVATGEGKIQAAAGYQSATFGVYGDVEIRAKVKVSNLTSEFGVVLRQQPAAVSTDPGDFENGLGPWTPTGGTLAVSTTQFHTGTSSALLTVSGSPATAMARPTAVTVHPGRSHRARMWVRCSATRNVDAVINWLDVGGGAVSSSTATVAVTANTWTLLEVTGTCPDGADLAQYGPSLTGSPANGTLLFIDDIELIDLGNLHYYTTYITPGTPDLLRHGKVAGASNEAIWTSTSQNIVAGDWWWFKAQISGITRRVSWWKDSDPEPTSWTWRVYDTAEATSTLQVPKWGEVGLFCKDGNALVTFGEVEINQWRAHAEIAALPPRWDLSRQDRWVPVTAAGVTRRLGQGRKTLESAVTLHLGEYTTSKMHIPLEQVDSSSGLADNRIQGGNPARVSGLTLSAPDLDGSLALPGVAGYVTMDQSTSLIAAQAAPGTIPSNIWSFFCILRLPSAPASDVLLYQVNATGLGRKYLIYLQTDVAFRVEVRSESDGLLDSDTALAYFGTTHPQGCWLACNLYVFSGGGTITWALNFHRPGGSGGFFTCNGGFPGAAAGQFREVRFNGSAAIVSAGGLSVTQLFHYPGDLPFVTADFALAANAYTGEEAAIRFRRLTSNARIGSTTKGLSTESKQMGAQLPSKLLDLLNECAEVDDGILTEDRDTFDLAIVTREALYNQVALDLNIDDGHLSAPLDPAFDDQRTRNHVTVRRLNGGAATSIQEEGPLNVNPPEDDPDGVGVYDESPEFRFASDLQLQGAADWRRSQGTIDEPRYPSIRADLAATAYDTSPALAAMILAKDSGHLLAITNREVNYSPTVQTIQSYTEHLDQYEYDLTFVTNPGDVRTVGVVGQTTRVQTAGHLVLDADFDAGTDTRLVSSLATPGSLWVQVADSPESFPFEIESAGCRLRVRATGDVLNQNPYFDEGIAGYQVSGTTTLYWDRYPGQFKSGIASMRMTATGATTGGAIATSAAQVPATAAVNYQISGWVRSNVGLSDVRLAVDWYQGDGTTFISTGLPTAIATTANVWVHFAATLTAPALTGFARVRVRAVLANTNIVWVDDLRLMPVSSFSASPQTLSVDQEPTNGVTGLTLPSGEPISVVAPWRVAYSGR